MIKPHFENGAEFLIFDIESTGLIRGVDIVLEFSFMRVNSTFTKVIEAGTLYFYQEGQRRSSKEAFAVHGITEEFLEKYASEYEQNLATLYQYMEGANCVGFYSSTFDVPFTRAFMNMCGYTDCNINSDWLDMKKVYMPKFGKCKLTELMGLIGVTEDQIRALQRIYFSHVEFKPTAHNASYDVCMTLFALVEAKRGGLLDV